MLREDKRMIWGSGRRVVGGLSCNQPRMDNNWKCRRESTKYNYDWLVYLVSSGLQKLKLKTQFCRLCVESFTYTQTTEWRDIINSAGLEQTGDTTCVHSGESVCFVTDRKCKQCWCLKNTSQMLCTNIRFNASLQLSLFMFMRFNDSLQ